MDPQEALLALETGLPAEQEAAKAALYGEYAARLKTFLERTLHFSPDAADAGAVDALMELFSERSRIVPEILGKSGQPWRWLIVRAQARATDYMRWARNLRGLSESDQEASAKVDLDEAGASLAADLDILKSVEAREVTTDLLAYAAELDQPERGILLGDLLRANLVDPEDAKAIDSEIIDCLHPWGIYSEAALAKRRQRLRHKLRERFKEHTHDGRY